jgi:hypothetical protein
MDTILKCRSIDFRLDGALIVSRIFALLGNELISYNSSLFELGDDDGQQFLREEPSLASELKGRTLSSDAEVNLLEDDGGESSTSLDIPEKDVDLLELLGEPSAAKKRKGN